MEELHRRKVREAGEISSSHDQSVIVTEETQKVSIPMTLEERYATILEVGENAKNYRSPTPKIQKVTFLRRYNKNFEMYYEPRLLSLGPIHHGKPKYKLGEKYKIVLTYAFIKDSGKEINELYRKIEENINDLRYCFEEEVTGDYDDQALAWLLFVDGCAILQHIYCATKNMFNELNIKTDSVAFAQQDLFLLENQLPYRLLKRLMSLSKMENELKQSIETYIASYNMVLDSRQLKQQARDKKGDSLHSISMEGEPVHLLDLLRTRILGEPNIIPNKYTAQDWQSYRKVHELKAAGIRFRCSSNSCLSNICFTMQYLFLGYLSLPPIIVDESTRPMFLNLIAYEMCLDFENDFGVTSYISFLDSLISDANDVKELRKASILHNFLPSDEEVAKLFNEIGTELVPNPKTYLDVRIRMGNHYHTLWSWMFRFYNDHFGGTWSIAGFLGVVLGLVLSGIQAWFTVNQASQRPASS